MKAQERYREAQANREIAGGGQLQVTKTMCTSTRTPPRRPENRGVLVWIWVHLYSGSERLCRRTDGHRSCFSAQIIPGPSCDGLQKTLSLKPSQPAQWRVVRDPSRTSSVPSTSERANICVVADRAGTWLCLTWDTSSIHLLQPV
jgi:hypothetical protein